MIYYLNNSATSYPKPAAVAQAAFDAMTEQPGMTGRGEESGTKDKVLAARISLARFFGCPNPERLIFTSNSTSALNQAIHGFVDHLSATDPIHVVTTSNDHNSVLRPLRTLESRKKVELTIVQSDERGVLDPAAIIDALRPDTRILAVNHLSNVVGTAAPLRELGEACREGNITFLVDASQSAGLLEIDVEEMGIDLLAITGHKYMLGPTGIGALYIAEGVELAPRKQGGTGVKSEYKYQPEELPIRFEAGTVNYIGIIALDAARAFIEKTGLETIYNSIRAMCIDCEEKLRSIDGVTVYGPSPEEKQGAVISFRIAGHGVAEVDAILRSDFGIICRSGLHCAPLCHQRLGTSPDGTIRVSFSSLTCNEASDKLVAAIQEIVQS